MGTADTSSRCFGCCVSGRKSIVYIRNLFMPPRHILVPLDFSPLAEYVLDYAITMAHLFQTRLTLLHVIHTAMFSGSQRGHEPAIATYVARVKADAQQALASLAERVQDMGLDCATEMVEGIPFQTICNQAREHQVDLLVMGCHARAGPSPSLLGSVAERVVRLAPCSVLVVRDGDGRGIDAHRSFRH